MLASNHDPHISSYLLFSDLSNYNKTAINNSLTVSASYLSPTKEMVTSLIKATDTTVNTTHYVSNPPSLSPSSATSSITRANNADVPSFTDPMPPPSDTAG